MTKIPTLTEFLENTGCRLRLYDMGRRVVKIPRDNFLKFEHGEIPYPFPMQQKAWFGILFQEQDSEPFIWFLSLPLDELGHLIPTAKDDLLRRLLERIGENIQAAREGEKLQNALEDNPYSFKPRDDRMAVFHAKASRDLKQSASKHYIHAYEYFSGALGWDQWPFVGYQGIADIAARLKEKDNAASLAQAIQELPARPLEALCHCLENEKITLEISQALFERVKITLREEEPEPIIISSSIRAMALSCSARLHKNLLQKVLEHSCACNPDILGAISARSWESLKEPQTSLLFLERLAENKEGGAFFNQCLGDLLFIPGMRAPLLTSIRNPIRSEILSKAIGELFGRTP